MNTKWKTQDSYVGFSFVDVKIFLCHLVKIWILKFLQKIFLDEFYLVFGSIDYQKS